MKKINKRREKETPSLLGEIFSKSIMKILERNIKRVEKNQCVKCGKKLELVKGETNLWKHTCKCNKKNIYISKG